MLTHIHPKLPMRNKEITRQYYIHQLGFSEWGGDFPDYLMIHKDQIEIHFFLFKELDPYGNYGQVYIRVNNIESYYQSLLDRNIVIHPNDPLNLDYAIENLFQLEITAK
jgi:hypothetical protein